MTTAAERRFIDAANANPQGFEIYIRNRLGVSGADAAKLFAIHESLHRGNALGKSDIEAITHAYRGQISAREVADIAAGLNGEHPGDRPRQYLALLAGDIEALYGQPNPGKDLRDLTALAEGYHRETMVEAINAKRESREPRDRAAVEVQRPEHDPLSTRELIERQMQPVNAREISARIDAGSDPGLTAMFRESLAETAEKSMRDLASDETDLRGAISAAVSMEQVRGIAEDQGFIESEE